MALVNSKLNLTVDKGPKQGETLARNPGELIRIGRVVKGNNFPIKDPGISQKHLTIEFASEISRWTVTDLDTSNGTFVNGSKIQSLTAFPLSDGDTIKIGESTSISVKIDGGGENWGGSRRGRSRGARSRAGSLESVVEEENDEVRVEEPKNLGRGRPRRRNSSRISKKDEILDAVVEDNVEVRPTRARTRAASAQVSKDDGYAEADAKKNELLDLVVEDSIEALRKARRGRPRKAPARTRASSPKVIQADEVVQSDSVAEGVVEKEELNVESNTAADAGRAPACTRDSSSNIVRVHEGTRSDSVAEGAIEREEVNIESSAAIDAGKEEESVAEEKGKMVEEEMVVDFEKMTLGEWFDSMEKYLPQAINEVAEQMIASLKEKARCFDEYVMNTSNVGQLLHLNAIAGCRKCK